MASMSQGDPMYLRKLNAIVIRALLLAIWACACMLTLGSSPASASCPNESLRSGPSSLLPDCRAYELVTPPDSNGRRFVDVSAIGGVYDLFETELASPLHDSFVFSALIGPVAAPLGANGVYDVYEARRGTSGWEIVRRLSPSGNEAVLPDAGGVSADHRYSFTHVHQIQNGAVDGGSLAADGDADYLAGPDDSFELTGVGSLGVERLAQGLYISPDGSHVIFTTGGVWCAQKGLKCKKTQLELDAPLTGTAAIYDRAPDGPTQVVSLLPGDQVPAAGEHAEYQGASRDGTAIAFKIEGILYVRSNNAETKKVTEEPSTYAGLSATGDRLFYVIDGNIYRFDTRSGQEEQISSSGDGRIVNISADGSHVYFISLIQLEGSEGTAGQPNMYVWSGGSPEYIATVLPSDLQHTSGNKPTIPALGNWTSWVVNPDRQVEVGRGPGANASRTTPDGDVMVFESRARLTSYDNAGHTQVYRYDDDASLIQCVSCSPLAEPATADARLQELDTARPPTVIHNLSEDGTKVFFETSEALASRDVDGINDIYQWQTTAASPFHSLDLISSGISTAYPPAETPAPEPNVLMGITPTGKDVFFLSQDALLPAAGGGGASAIYDARIEGGFPPAPSAAPSCGDPSQCQGSGEFPRTLPAPSSSQVRKGNIKHRKSRCRRAGRRSAKAHKHRKCHRRRHSQGAAR
jgi:hypothetical protein